MAQLGRYELLRRIGVGGMAEIYLARRRGPGGIEKRLVIKRIRPERARDARFRDLFVREAELSMSLAHKNIVPMFDFGRAGDELFLVMELVDGPNLAMALARGRGIAPEPMVVAHIGFEACLALDYAHRSRDPRGQSRPIAHRDVTPANVLLSFSGEVKLADFGVAAAIADAIEGPVRGTPAYMAPEQARGEASDARSDLYGLGLVLLEALTGDRARRGSASSQLEAARAGELPALPDDIPAPLRAVLARATDNDPAQRFADATSMAAALDEYLLAARAAADADRRPLGSQLAAWLRGLYPDGLPNLGGDATAPRGSIATFLEDGLDAVRGDATMQSLAETVDENASTADPPPADEAKADAELPRRRGVALLSVAAATALIGGAAIVALGGGGSPGVAGPVASDAATASPDAASPDAAPANAALPDAASPDGQPGGAADAATRIRRRPRPQPRAVATGVVKLSTTPWARVTVRGRGERCAETPCRLTLPAGRHTLLFENPVVGLEARTTIEVVAGETLVVDESLSRRGGR